MTDQMPDFMQSDEKIDFSALASDEQLSTVRKLASRLAEIDDLVKSKERDIETLKAEKLEISMRQLPEMFASLGIDKIGVPGANADVVSEAYYHANIKADWEQDKKDAAFGWLEENGHGDILTIDLSVSLPRGNIDEARRLQKLLREHTNQPISFVQGVPWNTLTKFVKEQTLAGATIPLETLGATVGQMAKIKKRK